MKRTLLSTSIAAVSSLLLAVAPSYAADCGDIGSNVKDSVAKDPEKLLVIVDKMISKHESCACEIVKAAIDASGADKKLVRDIVVTAVSAANGMAATIAECALAAAPEAASEIGAGLSEVFEGAEPTDDEEEEVVVDGTDDFGPDPIDVSGVYLIAPVSPSAASFTQDPRELARRLGISLRTATEIIRTGDTLAEVLARRNRPSRDEDRGGGGGTPRPPVQTP